MPTDCLPPSPPPGETPAPSFDNRLFIVIELQTYLDVTLNTISKKIKTPRKQTIRADLTGSGCVGVFPVFTSEIAAKNAFGPTAHLLILEVNEPGKPFPPSIMGPDSRQINKNVKKSL